MPRPPLATLALLGVLAGTPPGLAAQIPDRFENLQVLPADISRDSLVALMRGFSFALGVRCSHCHVGGANPNTLQGVQFHRDDDPDKEKARFMMRMLDSLNRRVLTALPERGVPPVVMECKTCHRGQPRPLLLGQELEIALDSGGVGAAVARYRALREREAMSGAFDFGEWEVNVVAERLVRAERHRDAIALYEMNAEFHPRSAAVQLSLGQLYERTADTASAVGAYRRVLELQPNHNGARRALERLTGR